MTTPVFCYRHSTIKGFHGSRIFPSGKQSHQCEGISDTSAGKLLWQREEKVQKKNYTTVILDTPGIVTNDIYGKPKF